MSRYFFETSEGATVWVGWDWTGATFFAQMAHPGEDPQELIGEMPFEVLHSDDLVVALGRMGIELPQDVRRQLAEHDEPARDIDIHLDRVLRFAASAFDRPGYAWDVHQDAREALVGLAFEARLREIRRRLDDGKTLDASFDEIVSQGLDVTRRELPEAHSYDADPHWRGTLPEPGW